MKQLIYEESIIKSENVSIEITSLSVDVLYIFPDKSMIKYVKVTKSIMSSESLHNKKNRFGLENRN